MKTLIIAEAGVNHNGDLSLAMDLVDVASDAGADYVKFQTFQSEEGLSKHAVQADYQVINTGKVETQLEMVKKLELSHDDHYKIIEHCQDKKIKFLSTAFGLKAIDFLKKFKMEYYKIPSGEINNLVYLKKIGKLKKKIILSTGMSNLNEIGTAIKVLKSCGTKKNNITVLQCNTEYPTPLKDVNLKAMLTIKKEFKIDVGYSDHTEGIEAAITSAALGAKIIEKHVNLDNLNYGPDRDVSINFNQLKEMVSAVRLIEKSLGSNKKIYKSEMPIVKWARRSIVSIKDINKGEKLTPKNIFSKRPSLGIPSYKYFDILGKKINKNIQKNTLIKMKDIS